MKKKNLLFLSVFIFLLFFLLTLLVGFNLFNNLDTVTTQNLQNYIPRFLDVPFSLFSLVGSFEIVLILLLILWAKRKQLNYIYVLIFFGFFHITEFLGKFFINHPNPPLRFVRYSIPFSFPTSEVNTGSSFPSGHMGRTIFLAIIFIAIIYASKRFSKVQKRLFYCLIFLISLTMFISRVYLGEHWLSDVIGGSLLGSVFGVLSLLVLL